MAGAALALAALVWAGALAGGAGAPPVHTNNWAVLVSTSKFWFNYRHAANTLSMYRTVRRLGIPDSNILLFLSEDVACNPRNVFQGQVFNDREHGLDLYGPEVEVDYRGAEVTVENFLRVLTGRHPAEVPQSKRLLSGPGSNVLVYLAGHGGDTFMKVQDSEILLNTDVSDALAQMESQGRFRELLLFVETCEAATMLPREGQIRGLLGLASSAKGEKSWSYQHDPRVGVSVIDQVTYHTLDFLESIGTDSRATFQDLTRHLSGQKLSSAVVTSGSGLAQKRLVDFFGAVPAPASVLTHVPALPVRPPPRPQPGTEQEEPEEKEGVRKQPSSSRVPPLAVTPPVRLEHAAAVALLAPILALVLSAM